MALDLLLLLLWSLIHSGGIQLATTAAAITDRPGHLGLVGLHCDAIRLLPCGKVIVFKLDSRFEIQTLSSCFQGSKDSFSSSRSGPKFLRPSLFLK